MEWPLIALSSIACLLVVLAVMGFASWILGQVFRDEG